MTLIALFGTSADPPTIGHQAILKWLSEHFDQVAVWASDNPFKAHQTTLHHRQEMLRLLVEDTHLPQAKVVADPHLSDPKTLTTVKRARQRWPEAEFTFAIGSDLVPKLHQWYRIEAVFAQVQLLVIPRPGHRLNQADLELLGQKGANITLANFTGPDVSSTGYRQRHEAELTPSVRTYIHQQGLYTHVDAATGSVSSPIPGTVSR